MRITIAGPGALGCLFGAHFLRRSEHHVWFVDHERDRAAFLSTHGLHFSDRHGIHHFPVRATARAEEVGATDLIFLCVKSHDTATALEQLSPLASPDSLLIALQNGIGHHRSLEQSQHPFWALGVTAQGASLTGPGQVKHGGDGPTFVGFSQPVNAAGQHLLNKAVQTMNRAGLETVSSPDILSRVWNKLIVNAGINGLTVLLDSPNGAILTSASTRKRLAALCLETAAVARAKDIGVTENPVAMAEEVCRRTKDNISSMLQDVRRGRTTEIEAINGAVVREAEELGLEVPENRALLAEITARTKKIKSTTISSF